MFGRITGDCVGFVCIVVLRKKGEIIMNRPTFDEIERMKRLQEERAKEVGSILESAIEF